MTFPTTVRSPEELNEIKRLIKLGLSIRRVERKFKINWKTIYKLIPELKRPTDVS